jgi:hypothetical protein
MWVAPNFGRNMKAKFLKLVGLMSLVGMCAGELPAQEANELELLRKEMREMRKHMEELEQKIQKLEQKPELPSAPTTSVVTSPTNVSPSLATENSVSTRAWSPTDPIRIGKGGVYADLGLVATFAAGGSTADDIEGGTQLGGHDPNQRGFTVQGVEMNLQGAVDPYLRGNANIAFLLDSGGETGVELEEAWLETISLPWNLQVRAGQILTDFGRINTQHPHAWAFVDVPLANGRFFGEDGLRNPGARLSWLAPTPFYSELFFNVQDSQGETAFSFRNDHEGQPFLGRFNGARPVKSMGDLLYTARYAVSFDVTDTQTLLGGTSATFGPNSSGTKTDTQIYGVDLYWKWKAPDAHAGFPFVSWQTEAMLRRYEAGGSFSFPGTSSEAIVDWGFYSQMLWGFKPGWVAGLRGDFLTGETAEYEKLLGPDLDRATRWRISPNLTWYPSEFSKIRLQYNYDDREGFGVDHSVWLQFELLLGAHAAHKF